MTHDDDAKNLKDWVLALVSAVADGLLYFPFWI